MSKILLTGMSSPQVSKTLVTRSMSYSGFLYAALLSQGHEVDWLDPDISWTAADLLKYDAALVGLSPLTSLSASKVYGALSVIDRLFDSSRLTLFIDAPEPEQITNSLRSISANPDSLVKPFYSYRKQYEIAKEDGQKSRLLAGVDRLLNSTWPTTIYPLLPWHEKDNLPLGLPVAQSSLIGLNLDALAVGPLPDDIDTDYPYWAVSSNKGDWIETLSQNIMLPTLSMKANKASSDQDVAGVVKQAIGSIIAPQKNRTTWWSYRYIQSLSLGTPVISEWRDTQKLDTSWGLLAGQVEKLPALHREQLANDQLSAYLAQTPTAEQAVSSLEALLGIKSAKEKR